MLEVAGHFIMLPSYVLQALLHILDGSCLMNVAVTISICDILARADARWDIVQRHASGIPCIVRMLCFEEQNAVGDSQPLERRLKSWRAKTLKLPPFREAKLLRVMKHLSSAYHQETATTVICYRPGSALG